MSCMEAKVPTLTLMFITPLRLHIETQALLYIQS